MDSSTPEWMRLLLDTPLPEKTPWTQASQDSNQVPFAEAEDVADSVLPSQITALASEALAGGNASLATSAPASESAPPVQNLCFGHSMAQRQEDSEQCGRKLPRWDSSESSSASLSGSLGVPHAYHCQDDSSSKAALENVLGEFPESDKSCSFLESSSDEACGFETPLSSGPFSIQFSRATSTSEDEELQNFVSACFFSGLQAVSCPRVLSMNPEIRSQEVAPKPSVSRQRQYQGDHSQPSDITFRHSPKTAPAHSRMAEGTPPSCANVSTSEEALPLTSDSRREPPAGSLEAALQRAVSRATTRRSSPSTRSISRERVVSPSPSLDDRGLNFNKASALEPKMTSTNVNASAASPVERRGLSCGLSVKTEDAFGPTQANSNWNNDDVGWEAEEESMIREDEDGGEGMEGFLMECGVGKRKRIMRERQRRSNIRQQVKRLRALLPAGNGRSIPQDTASIIAAAADYIKQLKGL